MLSENQSLNNDVLGVFTYNLSYGVRFFSISGIIADRDELSEIHGRIITTYGPRNIIVSKISNW